MSETRFRTIVADPPWPIKWTPGSDKIRGGKWYPDGPRAGKPGREMAYATMSLAEIAALDVESVAAQDAFLFLWATRRIFREGEAAWMARAWGFEPCGEIVWGLRSPGLGTTFRNDHEPVLVARRGTPQFKRPLPTGVQFWKQVYEWTGRAPAKVHSAKPDAFLDEVEQSCEGPYLELFARRARFGWEYAGNESLSTVKVEGLAA